MIQRPSGLMRRLQDVEAPGLSHLVRLTWQFHLVVGSSVHKQCLTGCLRTGRCCAICDGPPGHGVWRGARHALFFASLCRVSCNKHYHSFAVHTALLRCYEPCYRTVTALVCCYDLCRRSLTCFTLLALYEGSYCAHCFAASNHAGAADNNRFLFLILQILPLTYAFLRKRSLKRAG